MSKYDALMDKVVLIIISIIVLAIILTTPILFDGRETMIAIAYLIIGLRSGEIIMKAHGRIKSKELARIWEQHTSKLTTPITEKIIVGNPSYDDLINNEKYKVKGGK